MPKGHILVVDDEPEVLRFCSRVLAQMGYTSDTAQSGQRALDLFDSSTYDLLVLDIKMPDVDGLTVLRRARASDPTLVAVIITGYASMESNIEALNMGARGFVLKPFGVDEFRTAVERALDQRQQEVERLLLKAQLPILEISQTLVSATGVEAMAESLLKTVLEQTGTDLAALLLAGDEDNGLALAETVELGAEGADRGPSPPVPFATRIDLDVAAHVLQQEQPYVAESQALPLVYVPLHARNRSVGVLCLGRPASGQPFNAIDLGLLAIVSTQMATALDNVRLYEKVRAARDYTRTVLDSLHDEVLVLNRDYSVADVNQAFLKQRQYAREDVIGKPCYRISHSRDHPCEDPQNSCPAAKVWSSGQPARDLHVHKGSAGQRRYVDVAAAPVYDKQGRICQVVEAYRDVSAEWRLEASLVAIRAMGQRLVLSRDRAEIVHTVLETAEKVLGFDRCSLWMLDAMQSRLVCRGQLPEEGLATPAPLALDADDEAAMVARTGQSIYRSGGRDDAGHTTGDEQSRSRLYTPLRVNRRIIGVLYGESQEPDAFDQSDGRLFSTLAAQAALALENARLFGEIEYLKGFNENLVQNMSEGMTLEDADGCLTFVNPAGAAMVGRTPQELIGHHWFEFVPADQQETVRAAHERHRRGESDRYEVEVKHSDGTRLPLLVAGRPLFEEGRYTGTLAVFSDVSVLKKLQARLIQSEKLAALGRLTASLAHEINNPLQALSSGLGLLASHRFDEDKQRHYLEVANREVERLIGITERMLNFHRASPDQRQVIDVNELLTETLALVNKKLQHSQVDISCHLAAQPLSVEAVAGQLKQVFLNIILNALDAMPGGGQLIVRSTRNTSRDNVCLSFSDTGEGIRAENLARIFEPFFTTKARGTGMGLAVSYDIVERHNGRIEVESQPGQGSTFTVCLPEARKPFERGMGK